MLNYTVTAGTQQHLHGLLAQEAQEQTESNHDAVDDNLVVVVNVLD